MLMLVECAFQHSIFATTCAFILVVTMRMINCSALPVEVVPQTFNVTNDVTLWSSTLSSAPIALGPCWINKHAKFVIA